MKVLRALTVLVFYPYFAMRNKNNSSSFILRSRDNDEPAMNTAA